MRTLVTMFFALILALTATAQPAEKKKIKDGLDLVGEVYDSFTKAKVKAFVTLMNADSTVVDTVTCWTHKMSNYSRYAFIIPRKEQKYIIKAQAEGWEDTCMVFEAKNLRRKHWIDLPTILMKRKAGDIYKDVDLEGVTVTGTRVQVVYRGDTIVYDAAAFKLPEGSMLDGLIRQLPGAELKDNGDIYINGEKIDYLTLNGKDFFKGDNKVMLDNLPYFTVKNLKVYHKDTEQSELMGKQLEKKDYVMDVTLKREYSRGYIANAEAGVGTENRWMAKLFGSYYDDHSRVTAYVNLNNVNENRTPGADGEWSPSKMSRGLQTTRQAGLNVNTEDKDKNVRNRTDVKLEWTDTDNEQHSFRETFNDAGSIFGGSSSMSRNKDFRLNFWNNFQMKKIYLVMNTNVSVRNNDSHSSSADSTYSSALINRSLSLGRRDNKYFSVDNIIGKGFLFDSGDHLVIQFFTTYNRQKPSRSFDNRNVFYANTGANDERMRFNDTPSESYSFSPQIEYTYQLPNQWQIRGTMYYQQNRNSVHSLHYRLEQLAEADFNSPGWLPSTTEALASSIDLQNSRSYVTMERRYMPSLALVRATDNSYFYAGLPLSWIDEKIDYDYKGATISDKRRRLQFTPTISLSSYGNTVINFYYRVNVNPPSFYSLMPFDDSSNPLSQTLVNGDLKNTVSHYATGRVTFNNDSIGSSVYVGFEGSVYQNSLGNRSVYNSSTGAYTYMKDNIDGNWNIALKGGWQRPLDAKKRLRMDISGKAEYYRSVDFASLTAVGSGDMASLLAQSPVSKVDNVNLSATAKLNYKLGDLSTGIIGKVASRHSRGNLDIVRPIDAVDFQYGWNATYTVPVLKLTVATDINMYSRRGYETAMMNTDELVWNAQLSRSFLKGALTAKLQAYDLLQQLSAVRYSVNAQGRTETWYNCIPRYVMFSLAYRFTQKPKK